MPDRASRSAKVRPVGPAPMTTTCEVDLSMTVSRGGRRRGAEPQQGSCRSPYRNDRSAVGQTGVGGQMDRVLVLYYSQSGEVADIASLFATELSRTGAEVTVERLNPEIPYPYPWRSIRRFFDAMP